MLKHTVRHIRGRIEVVRHTEGVVGEDERTRLAITESRAIHSSNTARVGGLGAGQAHVVVGVVVGVDSAVLGTAGLCPSVSLSLCLSLSLSRSCVCARAGARVYVCMYACMYVRTYVRTYVGR